MGFSFFRKFCVFAGGFSVLTLSPSATASEFHLARMNCVPTENGAPFSSISIQESSSSTEREILIPSRGSVDAEVRIEEATASVLYSAKVSSMELPGSSGERLERRAIFTLLNSEGKRTGTYIHISLKRQYRDPLSRYYEATYSETGAVPTVFPLECREIDPIHPPQPSRVDNQGDCSA